MRQTDVNLKIAGLLGHQKIVDENTGECGDFWEYPPDSGEPYYVGPDYVNDPAQREPLMISLINNGWSPKRARDNFYYKKEYRNSKLDKHFGMSTCLAFIEIMGSKDE